jgi:hypothetical protein
LTVGTERGSWRDNGGEVHFGVTTLKTTATGSIHLPVCSPVRA